MFGTISMMLAIGSLLLLALFVACQSETETAMGNTETQTADWSFDAIVLSCNFF